MFRCRSFEEDSGSEVVFWFVAHVHDHSKMFAVLNDDPGILAVIPIALFGYVAARVTGSLRLSFPGGVTACLLGTTHSDAAWSALAEGVDEGIIIT